MKPYIDAGSAQGVALQLMDSLDVILNSRLSDEEIARRLREEYAAADAAYNEISDAVYAEHAAWTGGRPK